MRPEVFTASRYEYGVMILFHQNKKDDSQGGAKIHIELLIHISTCPPLSFQCPSYFRQVIHPLIGHDTVINYQKNPY